MSNVQHICETNDRCCARMLMKRKKYRAMAMFICEVLGKELENKKNYGEWFCTICSFKRSHIHVNLRHEVVIGVLS